MICGVIEDVNQVSKTSFSPTKPLGLPLSISWNSLGVSISGSIGKSEIFGKLHHYNLLHPYHQFYTKQV
jgi:hypothetical protein